MTREEAYKIPIIWNNTKDSMSKMLVDTIYNDFDSRTCENCKYKGCVYLFTADETEGLTAKDFGCNQFERKEAQDAHTS